MVEARVDRTVDLFLTSGLSIAGLVKLYEVAGSLLQSNVDSSFVRPLAVAAVLPFAYVTWKLASVMNKRCYDYASFEEIEEMRQRSDRYRTV